jgi:hypothetical protein
VLEGLPVFDEVPVIQSGMAAPVERSAACDLPLHESHDAVWIRNARWILEEQMVGEGERRKPQAYADTKAQDDAGSEARVSTECAPGVSNISSEASGPGAVKRVPRGSRFGESHVRSEVYQVRAR